MSKAVFEKRGQFYSRKYESKIKITDLSVRIAYRKYRRKFATDRNTRHDESLVRLETVKSRFTYYYPRERRGSGIIGARVMLGNCWVKLIGHGTRQVIRKYGVRGKKRSGIKRGANIYIYIYIYIRNETLTTRGEARLPTRRRRLANHLAQLTLEAIRERLGSTLINETKRNAVREHV